jgi:hypothetical protein
MSKTITLGDFGARCEYSCSGFMDPLLDCGNAIATRKSTVLNGDLGLSLA